MKTACPLDCPDACTLEVEVKAGKVMVCGDHRNSVTQGLVCGKVRRIQRQLECKERVRSPLRRTGPKGSGSFEPISWDEALDVLVEAFEARRHNPARVLSCAEGGSNGPLTHGTYDERLFSRYGASRVRGQPLRRALQPGAQGDVRQDAGHGLPRLRRERPDRDLGQQPSRHERALLELRAAGDHPGREARGDRSQTHQGDQTRRPTPGSETRLRPAARPDRDPLDP